MIKGPSKRYQYKITNNLPPAPKGVGRKFSRGGQWKKDQKLAKNSTICLFQGRGSNGKKEKESKNRPKNSTF